MAKNRAQIVYSPQQKAIRAVLWVLLAFTTIIVIFPVAYVILGSFKENQELLLGGSNIFPQKWIVQNYIDAFTTVSLGKYFLNTFIYTVATTACMLIVIVPAAFAFSRLEFKGKNLVFTLFLSLMMIPNELVIITNFQTITNWDLRNTFLGLILPSITSVFYIYLLKENFEQIPDELYRAAKVDGTSDFKYLLKVMIPIARPTLITIAILKIIECWNAYVWPRLITDNPAYYLVSNGIQEIREYGFGRENIPAMMAAVVAISVPLIVLFVVSTLSRTDGQYSVLSDYMDKAVVLCLAFEAYVIVIIIYKLYTRLAKHSQRDKIWMMSLIEYARSKGANTDKMRSMLSEVRSRERFVIHPLAVLFLIMTFVFLVWVIMEAVPFIDDLDGGNRDIGIMVGNTTLMTVDVVYPAIIGG